MWIVVGLGNPGNKYLMTRHNVGFMAIDAFLQINGRPPFKNEHQARTFQFTMDGEKLLFVQPQTFMNKSGESVQPLLKFYNVPTDKLIVIHDEIDQPFGTMKFQKNRGHGGHNGIRSTHELLGTSDYYRLRLGVGRPQNDQMNVADYVLQNFSKEEQSELPGYLGQVSHGLECLIFEGFDKASTLFNGAYNK